MTGSMSTKCTDVKRYSTGTVCQKPSGTLSGLDRKRIALLKSMLMPVRIRRARGAGFIEHFDLLRRQIPADRAEVLPQLFLVSRADQHRCNRRPLQQPVQRDLRHRLAGFLGDSIERIDNAIRYSSGTGGPISAVLCSRLDAGSGYPRRILPVSRPQPSGLQTIAPTP